MVYLSLFLAKSIISKIWKRVCQNKIKLKKMKIYWIHLGKINICFQKNYHAKTLTLRNLCYLLTSSRKIKNKEAKMEHLDFKDQLRELRQIKKMISQISMISQWFTMISSLWASTTIKTGFFLWEIVCSPILTLKIMWELHLEAIKCKFYKTRNFQNSECNQLTRTNQ